MEIKFTGKYKSITTFEWTDIPKFVVITGPNGTGKSQLLELIYNTIIDKQETTERLQIVSENIKPNEVIFLKGEWQLENTTYTDLSTIQSQLANYFQQFQQNIHHYNNNQNSEHQLKLFSTFKEILVKVGKNHPSLITKEEFDNHFPEILIERESQTSQKISEIFYNYRLSEIELLAKKKNEEEITNEIGVKPWIVLRDIIKEAKLAFEINDPSENGFRDGFQLKLSHNYTKENINFDDLSSGEKVLLSLVFYLYNSQEKNIFPKILLLDEPDAHLHPSMSQQFLNVVKNVLVDKFGVQVIMTTHSPSTVILAPIESIFEMSRTEPRIKKSTSKNNSVSILTSGLIYVGEGTKYFLVEDNDDVTFYSFIYNQLTTEKHINADIPLVFIPASTKDKSGGKDAVQNWVKKLQSSGLENIVQGLIDADYGNVISNGVYKINRYSIENYLIDPIIVYGALLDKEKNEKIDGIQLELGEEYKLKLMSNVELQKIADSIILKVETELPKYFNDFDCVNENERIEVNFVNNKTLLYPKWLLSRRGKTILNEVYNDQFKSTNINFSTLFKALKKINMIPMDLVEKLNELKNVS